MFKKSDHTENWWGGAHRRVHEVEGTLCGSRVHPIFAVVGCSWKNDVALKMNTL